MTARAMTRENHPSKRKGGELDAPSSSIPYWCIAFLNASWTKIGSGIDKSTVYGLPTDLHNKPATADEQNQLKTWKPGNGLPTDQDKDTEEQSQHMSEKSDRSRWPLDHHSSQTVKLVIISSHWLGWRNSVKHQLSFFHATIRNV